MMMDNLMKKREETAKANLAASTHHSNKNRQAAAKYMR